MKTFIALLLTAGLYAPGHFACLTHAPNTSPLGTLTPTTKMGTARAAHTATRLPDGRVLIAGGMERNGVFFASAELYQQASGQFSLTKSGMNTPRVSHTATLLPDGRVLLVGGWAERSGPTASAETYDPATDSFTPVGAMHTARAAHTATLLGDGKILIAGGFDGSSPLRSAELFDPATGRFTPAGNLRGLRSGHSANLLRDGRVLIAGGSAARNQVLSTAEIYNPQTHGFAPTGEMTVVRHKHASVLLPDGQVLLVGGSDGRDWGGRYTRAETYDTTRGIFTGTAEMNTPRFKMAETAVLLPDGKVLIAGGGSNVEIYNPATRTFSIAADGLGEPRHFATATLLPDGRTLIVGGYGRGTPEAGPVSTALAWIFDSRTG